MKTILIDGVIGTGKDEISSKWFEAQLPTDGSEIHVKIHSEGGSVVEGFRIFDLAKGYDGPKRVTIESAAYSIASFIPMAFDEVEITPNGFMMLHNPYMQIEGDDEELAAKAGFLAKLKGNMVEAYSAKTGLPEEQIKSILKAESYLNAREVVAAGFADRITEKPVRARVFAKIDSMPHGVVTALFGPGSGGDVEPRRETPMTDSTPKAATVTEIKAAYPQAKAEFVLDCVEKQLPMASVATAAAEEMMKENAELAKANATLQEEIDALKAAAAKAEGDEMEEEAAAEETAEATAKSGVKPVAKGAAGRPAAKARWDEAIAEATKRTNGNKMKAAALANRENPGLRKEMLAEVNA